jgi:hypothetical protein
LLFLVCYTPAHWPTDQNHDAHPGELHESQRLEHPLLSPDCQTLISGWVTVRTEATLLRLLKASGATAAEMDEIERDIRRWGRSSSFIDVNETGRQLLRILPEP